MTEPKLSVAALDQATETILNNNFDADTKICFITLMKVLDAVIQKPFDPKVRSIRLSNAAFSNKVASRKGGVEFLLACGFERITPTPGLLSTGNAPQEEFLVLKDDVNDNDEDNGTSDGSRKEAYKKHIITARRLLMTRAIQDLHMTAEELPTYKPPPPLVATSTQGEAKRGESSSSTFNPYRTQRYDGMSAAVGAQLTPDGTYQSSTDTQLKALQQKQEKLEQKLQKQLMDREWAAKPPPSANSAAGAMTMQIDATDENNDKGSASLVAAQFQKQQADRKRREEGGFTTKNMRELEKLKKQKVYTHTQLALRFADGTVLQGKFLPKETIATVLEALQDCLLETISTENIHLYIAPPKQVLKPTDTLESQGLVPAAKVSVSLTLPKNRPFLKPHLFANNAQSAFPSAQPVVAGGAPAAGKDAAEAKPAAAPKPPMTAEEKEAAMMQRMLGGGRRLGATGGSSSSGDAKKSKGGVFKKPSWMK